ncbi:MULTISPECIES: CYTH domain-containing protein [Staphylococcus]|uniref:CYTH domain-containing protein n=1 Tax=Staphylococcus hsinchuensis TaxID=3051183 RepID=A0ABZ3EB94_9STAP|nr:MULTISPECIES: CYTH domain-containing protein [unclassified Staphylococcus]
MSTNNEIEFKQLLTNKEYESFYNTYFQGEQPFKQTNFYIDTPDFQLMSKLCALRIRVKDSQYEMTLKTPSEVGLMEYNEPTDIKPQIDDQVSATQLPHSIREQLDQLQINQDNLVILGSLTTERLERPLEENLIVLDKSTYLGYEDYELEFEVTDYDKGLEQFKSILDQFDIEHVDPDNKVKRFFDRKQKLNKKPNDNG